MTKTADTPSPVPTIPGQIALFDVPDRGRLRSVREVAELLGIHRDTVYDRIRGGSLRATKPGGELRVSIPDLETYVRSTAVTPTNEPGAGASSPAPGGEDDL